MFNKKLFKILISTMMIIALGLSIAACGNKDDDNSKATGDKKSFANLSTTDIDGNKVDGSIFKDKKLTLVNVWGINCPPCIAEIPELETVSKNYADKGVAVVGLLAEQGVANDEEAKSRVKQLLEKSGATYKQLVLSDELLKTDVMKNIEFTPTSFFVNSKGEIVNTVVGAKNVKGWSELIDEQLGKLQKLCE